MNCDSYLKLPRNWRTFLCTNTGVFKLGIVLFFVLEGHEWFCWGKIILQLWVSFYNMVSLMLWFFLKACSFVCLGKLYNLYIVCNKYKSIEFNVNPLLFDIWLYGMSRPTLAREPDSAHKGLAFGLQKYLLLTLPSGPRDINRTLNCSISLTLLTFCQNWRYFIMYVFYNAIHKVNSCSYFFSFWLSSYS